MKQNKITGMLMAFTLLICSSDANGWGAKPSTNTEVVGSTLGNKIQMMSDISAINLSNRYAVTWQDNRNGAYDIYAQCFDAFGNQAWGGVTGVAVCTFSGSQIYPRIISDNSNNFYIAWQDNRLGNVDIYIQKMNNMGSAMWAGNGVPVVTACGDQTNIEMTLLSSGDVVVTWLDDRNGSSEQDVYAQRIDATYGTPVWKTNGIPVGCDDGPQAWQKVVADQYGGCVLVWQSDPNFPLLYGQKLDNNGEEQWGVQIYGREICTYSSYKFSPQVVRSGDNFFVSWIDHRNSTPGEPYYILLDANGDPYSGFSNNGVPLSSSSAYSNYICMVPDRYDGVYISWDDYRSGTDYDIWAKRLDNSGSLVSGWTSGVQVCNNGSDQRNPKMAACSTEVVITFEDMRAYSLYGVDLYYQNVASNGTLNLAAAGVALSDKPNDQKNHRTTIMADKVVTTWDDYSNTGFGLAIDVYCSEVNVSCTTTTTSMVVETPSTSINDVAAKAISEYKVYPNPAQLAITITHPTASMIDKLTIVSLDGKIVREISHFKVGDTLDVSELAVGEYIIHFSDSESTSTFKIVKQ